MHLSPLALVLPLVAALPLGAQDFRWEGTLASGKTLEIRCINGRINATRAAGAKALVTATKRGRDDDPAEVEIKVVEHSDGVTICALYPSRRSSRANECRPGGGGQHALGLDAAHEATDDLGHALGVVHRDVSPQNVS